MLKVQQSIIRIQSILQKGKLNYSSLVIGIFFIIFLFPSASQSESISRPFQEYGITDNNIFLYYEDYDAAIKFYDETLGFKLVLTIDTARMYHIANNSYVTAVRGQADKHNLSSNKPVTFALVTDQLNAWRCYLLKNNVTILSDVKMEEASLQQGFVALDPGGYYLNFVQFKPHRKNRKLMSSLNELESIYVNPKGTRCSDEKMGVKATVASFYYNDVKPIHKLYKKELGFKTIAKQKHSIMYKTSPSGFFRVVDGAHGFHKPIDDKALKKGAMMSFFTNDTVEGWFEFIRKRKDVELRLPKMSDREELKAFAFNDYEGYSLEFDYFPEAKLNMDLRKSIKDNADVQSAVDLSHYSSEKPWRGSSKEEKMFFTLGMMNAYAESVHNKAKILGLGEPLTAEETDDLYEHAKMIAQSNKVKIYREKELLVTDLFPASITKDRHVILIYIDDTLDKYLKIKADKEKLVKSGKYTGDARKNIARRFGKLLSYKDDVVEEKLRKKLNSE
jgi:catechol 2,3-dioxygenase-like lactoylglutathione lyase family enzyme